MTPSGADGPDRLDGSHEIVIIGGGIIGSFVAYWLAASGRAGSVAVIEPDPTYKRSSTANGAGGVRQLFSRPENIRMSQFSLDFYRDFAHTMTVNGEPADIGFEQRGYLFLVGDQGARQLEANHNRQQGEGVTTELLTPAELLDRFPSLGLDGIALGCLSPDDATIETALALRHLRAKVELMGVTYLADRVAGFELGPRSVKAVRLESGRTITADTVVNAAGAWAGTVAEMAEMTLPVVPMCRVKHHWTVDAKIEPLPLVKDETAMFFRPSGDGFVGGRPTFEIRSGLHYAPGNEDIERHFDGYFERVLRPLVAARVPAFNAATETRTWMAHYAQNTFDGNMILGRFGLRPNFIVAAGFSGHGIMHAPAVGRAASELILDGDFATLDVGRFSTTRIENNAPYPEEGII